ncbi:MAG: hypothetical protein CM1200mP9_02150 [Gammaproteobacteria bacterium]|nr:MAG: hypothetical protein CM1200mP9_02150 [Gammaproteobacteria bacterium]
MCTKLKSHDRGRREAWVFMSKETKAMYVASGRKGLRPHLSPPKAKKMTV